MSAETLQDEPLFDATPFLRETPKPSFDHVDIDTLDGFAFLYTATDKGNCSGVRFAASRDDAMKWCESPASTGTLHGTAWAYFWTAIPNFLKRWGFDEIEADTFDLSDVIDDGSWDERVASTGCTMLKRREIADLLNAAGVKAA